MSKLAIVYFSETNNTKAAAEYVATKVDAKLVRVEAKKNTNPMKGILRISSEPLGEPWKQIADCDRVLLMSPVYAWSGIPELIGFLMKCDLSDKDVMIITSGADTNSKSGMKVAAQYQKHIEKVGGTVGPCVYHQGGEYKKFSGESVIAKNVDTVLDQILAWLKK